MIFAEFSESWQNFELVWLPEDLEYIQPKFDNTYNPKYII